MKKILIVFGTRPEAIKMAPVVKEIEKSFGLKGIVCVTAQHREMLDQVLKIFNIQPDYDLNIMKDNQDLFDVSINTLAGLKDVLKKTKPDVVLVQGDTTTAFVAGLAAYYLKIPVAHIEAGLRTYNKYSPFPEEKNRHLLSVLAEYHFAPTESARSNLIKENIPADRIWVTGNTIIDALSAVIKNQKSEATQKAFQRYLKQRWHLELTANTDNFKLILVTGHRRESFGKEFESICAAIREISAKRKDVVIIYPAHLNPHVLQSIKKILKGRPNVHIPGPLEYELFVFLMNRAYLILTDSGGIQEEASSLGKPVLIMRNTTERPEVIKAGIAKLVGTDRERIVNETLELLDNTSRYRKMSKAVNLYGNGRAAERIVKILRKVIFAK